MAQAPWKNSWKTPKNLIFTLADLKRLDEQGEPVGFLRPLEGSALSAVSATLARWNRIESYCLIGIGGSALPARALERFFCHTLKTNRAQACMDYRLH